ncbi:MAG: hypothetical protein MUE30_00670 [Spirosomaceae bacterium]|jgi:hypothetical protein|nr:hypothetical protein [Spirosomataceae bacterium]
MKKPVLVVASVLAGIVLLSSCQKEEVTAPLVIPTSYDASKFDQNAAAQLAVVTAINDMTNEAKKGRVLGGKVSDATMKTIFAAGNPSAKSQTTTYFAGRLENEWFTETAKASGTTYTPGDPKTKGQGGMYGGYLFDENGLEIEQLIEKGTFGATLFNHAVSLVNGPMTVATADQLMAIMGVSPLFPNSATATSSARPDRAMGNYAARRDKNDGNGLYTKLKNDFLKLQAALKAGDKYNKERDEAVDGIMENWEKVNAATIINYCHSVIGTMSQTTTTDAQKSSALHAYGECVGFAHGFRTISRKKITDAQLDEILTLLNAPATGTPTSYLFITDPANQLPKLQQIITKLQNIYGFSAAEIEDFKKNWVSEQKR